MLNKRSEFSKQGEGVQGSWFRNQKVVIKIVIPAKYSFTLAGIQNIARIACFAGSQIAATPRNCDAISAPLSFWDDRVFQRTAIVICNKQNYLMELVSVAISSLFG